MNKEAQEAIDAMMKPRPVGSILFIVRNTQAGSVAHLVYTDQDLKVLEVRGPFSDKVYQDKWVGQHISKVRKDVARLYQTYIHRETWGEPDTNLNTINERRKYFDWYEAHVQTINRLRNKSDEISQSAVNDARESLKVIEPELKRLNAELNRQRCADFGENVHEVDDYFKFPEVKILE